MRKFSLLYGGFLVAMFALSFNAECAEYSVELAVGLNVSEYMPWAPDGDKGGFAGPQDVARVTGRVDFDNGVFLQASHNSHLSDGLGNTGTKNDVADWLDVVEIGYRYTFK